jgi:hypothetical protein
MVGESVDIRPHHRIATPDCGEVNLVRGRIPSWATQSKWKYQASVYSFLRFWIEFSCAESLGDQSEKRFVGSSRSHGLRLPLGTNAICRVPPSSEFRMVGYSRRCNRDRRGFSPCTNRTANQFGDPFASVRRSVVNTFPSAITARLSTMRFRRVVAWLEHRVASQRGLAGCVG